MIGCVPGSKDASNFIRNQHSDFDATEYTDILSFDR